MGTPIEDSWDEMGRWYRVTWFLGKAPDQIVLTIKLNDLLGSRGESWEILTATAFVSIAVPVAVFFSLQRFFVRGLLSGSVKGG